MSETGGLCSTNSFASWLFGTEMKQCGCVQFGLKSLFCTSYSSTLVVWEGKPRVPQATVWLEGLCPVSNLSCSLMPILEAAGRCSRSVTAAERKIPFCQVQLMKPTSLREYL